MKIRQCLFALAVSITYMLYLTSLVSAAGVAYVRIIHAAIGVGTVDVTVDGARLLHDFSFAAVTPYVQISSGSHVVSIQEFGTGVEKFTQSVTFDPDQSYTVAAAGTIGSGFKLYLFRDDNRLSAGKVKLRAYQLSYSEEANVVFSPSVSNQVVSYVSASEYVSLPPSTSTIQVSLLHSQKVLKATTTTMAQHVLSVFVVGLATKLSPKQQKVQIVLQDVAGIPGTPQTGSDPNVLVSIPYPSPVAFLIVIGIFLVGLIPVYRRRKQKVA